MSALERAAAVCCLAAMACAPPGASQDAFSAGWPEWQLLETGPVPPAWRLEEASLAFDAWRASVTVTRLSPEVDVSVLRVEDDDGASLTLRLPRLPTGALAPEVEAGRRVDFSLLLRTGFEGVARGLVLTDPASGEILLLYDDGGYGPAFDQEGQRGGLVVRRDLLGTGSGRAWLSPDVTFEMGGERAVVAEGETANLGASRFAVSVVVSQEWTGAPVTDVDLAPLAYLLYRVR